MASGAVIRWSAMALDPLPPLLLLLQSLHALSFGATHLAAVGFVARAAPIELGAGVIVRGVDIPMVRTRTVRVRGTLTNASGQVVNSGLQDVVLPVNIGQRTVSLAIAPESTPRLVRVFERAQLVGDEPRVAFAQAPERFASRNHARADSRRPHTARPAATPPSVRFSA